MNDIQKNNSMVLVEESTLMTLNKSLEPGTLVQFREI